MLCGYICSFTGKEEVMKTQKKSPGKLRLLAGYYKPTRTVCGGSVFAMVGAAVTLIIPLLVRYIMNNVGGMASQDARAVILKIGQECCFLFWCSWEAGIFITYYGHMMGAHIEHDMRNEIFGHYQKLSFAFMIIRR